ncbi:response regulator [Streptomyces sp. H10-C2]|uniref:response regulator n=1 Tax=unclassified Streptomyces TaxID=2593676 RepID=UPI0024BA6FB5|nr:MULTISPECIES: response regulator [unclassified Streptomyces]MDJ0347126.1 response regulator [Streptomyces sp. PH10-H1]MDJ0375372.1 response regulator [Streptomyces sp. H10-C2]
MTTASDGTAALQAVAVHPPDALILDLGLPDVDGIEVLLRLRTWSPAPIVVLSERTEPADTVQALDAGADDYLTKPFSLDELFARLRAVLRRGAAQEPDAEVDVGRFRIDLVAHTAGLRSGTGCGLHFTPTEWRLLLALLRNPGRLVTGRDLLRQVWGPGFERRGNYLRIYMSGLRHKLETDPSYPRHLITEPGVGYRFDP